MAKELPPPRGSKPKPRRRRSLPKARTAEEAARVAARDEYDRKVEARAHTQPHERFKDAPEKEPAKIDGLGPWLDVENPAVWSGNIGED